MFKYIKSLFFKNCNFCKTSGGSFVKYKNDREEIIHVCIKCLEYAERRAYRKVH